MLLQYTKTESTCLKLHNSELIPAITILIIIRYIFPTSTNVLKYALKCNINPTFIPRSGIIPMRSSLLLPQIQRVSGVEIKRVPAVIIIPCFPLFFFQFTHTQIWGWLPLLSRGHLYRNFLMKLVCYKRRGSTTFGLRQGLYGKVVVTRLDPVWT